MELGADDGTSDGALLGHATVDVLLVSSLVLLMVLLLQLMMV